METKLSSPTSTQSTLSVQSPTPPTFEDALDKLQFVVKKLESGELNLDQSLQQFEEGVRLTRLCQEQLSAAEQRVEILMKANAGQVEVAPFQNPKF